MVCVSFADQLLILFIPGNMYTAAAIFLLTIIGSYTYRRDIAQQFRHYRERVINTGRPVLIAFAISWAVYLLLSAGPVIMDDTGSYHIQSIKWIQQFGTVPGLANLYERYGFNSSWLSLVALFTPSDSANNYFGAINGLLSVWMTGHLLYAFAQSVPAIATPGKRARGIASISVLLAGLVCWPLLRGNATNSNYDFVTCLLLIVLADLIFSTAREQPQRNEWDAELLLWPVFLVSVRLTNCPLLLLSLWAFFRLFKKHKRLTLALSAGAGMVLALVFTRNVLLSGYLAFPFYQLDIFNVDWKADESATREIARFIKYFNRVNNGYMPIAQTQQLTGFSWIPYWFHYLDWYDKWLIALGLFGYIYFFVRHYRERSSGYQFLFACTMLVQLFAWMMIAPDPRFAHGVLLGGLFNLTAALALCCQIPIRKWLYNVFFGGLATGLLLYAINKTVSGEEYRNWTSPIRLPTPAVQTIQLGDMLMYIPEKLPQHWNRRCYGTNLPCLYEVRPGLSLRTGNLKDGFKITR